MEEVERIELEKKIDILEDNEEEYTVVHKGL